MRHHRVPDVQQVRYRREQLAQGQDVAVEEVEELQELLVNLVGGNVPTRLLEEAALCEGESVGGRGVERVVGGGRGRMRIRRGIRKRRNRRGRRVELGGKRERDGGLQLLGRGELDGGRIVGKIDGRDGGKSVHDRIIIWIIVDIVGLRGTIGRVHEIGVARLVQDLQQVEELLN